jgi:hypothetical protein
LIVLPLAQAREASISTTASEDGELSIAARIFIYT